MPAWNRINLSFIGKKCHCEEALRRSNLISKHFQGQRHMRSIIAVLALLLLALSVSQAPAALSNPWWTVDGGGGGSCYLGTGALSLCGSLGQPDASHALLTAGSYSLHSGFWSGPRLVRYVIYLPLASN